MKGLSAAFLPPPFCPNSREKSDNVSFLGSWTSARLSDFSRLSVLIARHTTADVVTDFDGFLLQGAWRMHGLVSSTFTSRSQLGSKFWLFPGSSSSQTYLATPPPRRRRSCKQLSCVQKSSLRRLRCSRPALGRRSSAQRAYEPVGLFLVQSIKVGVVGVR
jgi:hypothetical protein